MTNAIPGYTDYVTNQVTGRLDISGPAVHDFIQALEEFADQNNGHPRMIKASDLNWELEELASQDDRYTSYPDTWLLHTFQGNIADLIEVMEPVLKAHGIKCFVVHKDQYVLPELAKNRYIFFYVNDPFKDLNDFRKARSGIY